MIEFRETGFFLGIWQVLLLISILLPCAALISILKNQFNGNQKYFWVLIVFFIPILGSVLYFFIGRSNCLIKK